MFKNYLQVAFRHFWKNKTYLIINLIGMGLAIGICITTYLNSVFNASFDEYHEKKDNLFLVSAIQETLDDIRPTTLTPIPLIPYIKEQLSGIKRASRMGYERAIVRNGDHIFHEALYFAEPEFLDMFTFPLKYGDKQKLQDPRSIFLTPEMAEKYFGEQNVVGREISFRFYDSVSVPLIVAGVFEERPKSSAFQFGLLANYELWLDVSDLDETNWRYWAYASFVELEDPKMAEQIASGINPLLENQNEARNDRRIKQCYLVPVEGIGAEVRATGGNPVIGMNLHKAAVWGPAITAILILFTSCINFVNTTIASSTQRLREIGIRKVLGGSRGQLIVQLLTENVLLALMGMLVGLAVAEILVPAYSALWPDLHIAMNYSEHSSLILFILGLVVLTGLVAGAYPALYITRFKPVSIFNGKTKFGGNSKISQVLLVFQFVISFIAIGGGLIMNRNANYQETVDMGYNKESVISVPVQDVGTYERFRQQVSNYPEIVSMDGSRSQIIYSWYYADINHKGTQLEADYFQIGHDYLKTLGIQLVEGRDFDRSRGTDSERAVIVNQNMVDRLALEDPIGTELWVDSASHTIIGVTKDFFTRGLWDPVEPVVMKLTKEDNIRYLVVRTNADQLISVNEKLATDWAGLFPDTPYPGYFMEDHLVEAKRTTRNIRNVSGFMAIVATILSAIGLFALVSLNILKRQKEIGVRKVFGASVSQITQLISSNIFWMLLISIGLAIYPTISLYQGMLDSIYYYNSGINGFDMGVAGILLLLAAMATVGKSVYRAATVNPVEILRDE